MGYKFNLTGVRDPRVRAMRDPDLARRMQHPWIWQVATKNGPAETPRHSDECPF